jgi:hypothetical protein
VNGVGNAVSRTDSVRDEADADHSNDFSNQERIGNSCRDVGVVQRFTIAGDEQERRVRQHVAGNIERDREREREREKAGGTNMAGKMRFPVVKREFW